KPLFAVSDLRRHLIQVSSYPRKPLIKLRGVGVHGVYLLGKHRTNVEGHVRPERIRPLKVVLEIQEHRILFERRRVSRHVWDGYHVGGILYKYTCIAMIRMVVVGSGRNDDIGIPFAYLTDYLQPYFQCGKRRATVIAGHILGHPDPLTPPFPSSNPAL